MEKPHYKLIGYTIWLFIAWSIYVAIVYPLLPKSNSILATVLKESFRFAIFVVPLFLILKTWNPWKDLSAGKLKGSALLYGLLVACVWMAVTLAIAVFGQNRGLTAPSLYFWFTGFSFATIVEEFVFRGYVAKQLLANGKSIAVLVSSLLFVLIHYPGWIILGMLPSVAAFLIASVSIFLLGLVLGWIFVKFDSVWPCVIVHAGNNLVAAITVASAG